MLKNLKLNTTIFILLLIGLALPMFLTTIYLQNKFEKSLTEKLVNDYRVILKSMAISLSRPMWEYMLEDTKKAIEPFFSNEDILKIRVVDYKLKDKTFFQLEKKDNPNCRDTKKVLLKEDILLNKLKLGVVFLKISTCSISYQIDEERKYLWYIMGMQFLFSFSILFLLLETKIILPIRQLIAQSTNLANKKLDEVFIWSQKDEIGDLGNSLDDTRISLIDLFDKERIAKEHINNFNKTLEKRVSHEVKKNELKTKELIHKSKLAQMGELLSMISHQWRQPLTSISVTANNLLFKILLGKNIDNDEIKKEISSIVDFTQHLSLTIEDFRKFYQVDKEKEITTFEKIIENTIKIIKPILETNNIQVIKDFGCNKKINTYPSEIIQVVLNLFKNAEDVFISRNIEQPIISIKTYFEDNKVNLEIRDNAGGIKDEYIKQLFDPYFSTKTKKEGSGLGLYMSKIIIEDHCNGSISVKNFKDGVAFLISIDI